jgi:hypothetical protein
VPGFLAKNQVPNTSRRQVIIPPCQQQLIELFLTETYVRSGH